MSLTAVRPIFGIHSTTMYNRSTRVPYGRALKVLGGSSLVFSGELIKLMGGSFNYAWDVQDGRQTAEMTIKSREYPPFLYELFLGKAPTEPGADTDGTVTTLTNVNGSTIAADAGIGSVSVKAASKTDVKFTKFVIKATGADSVDVYGYSDQDFHRGTDIEFDDDDMSIIAADLTIAISSATEITSTGVEMNGGSTAIAMTSGDTAEFDAIPPSSKSFSVVIGNPTDRCPEFGCYVAAEVRKDGSMYAIDAFRCAAAGFPINMEEKAYSEAELKIELFHDADENGICEIRSVQPSSAT